METETWKKLESWRPVCYGARRFFVYQPRPEFDGMIEDANGVSVAFKTRAAALRAANKQNDLEGLPRVA